MIDIAIKIIELIRLLMYGFHVVVNKNQRCKNKRRRIV